MKTLQVLTEDKGQKLFLRFVGSIDEDAALDKVKVETVKSVVMDMGEVDSINSCGGREWVKWIRTVDTNLHVEFVNCSSVFLDYANMIEGFVPSNGVIESFNVPYYCESCDQLTLKVFQSKDIREHKREIPESIPCAKCKKPAEVDVIVPVFLKFLNKAKKGSS
jgi:hypothetical protein